MAAINKNLIIEQYSTFKARFTWLDKNKTAIDLTGYTAVMQVRDAVGSVVLIELNTENGRIAITPIAGAIELSLTDEETGALTIKSALYDLVLISSAGQATRLMEGKVTVSPGVTHV